MTTDQQDYWNEVVESVRAGNVDRFRLIIEEFREDLWLTVSYYTRGNAERTDELVHRAFVRAFRGLRRFEIGRPLGPWLKQIARHEVLNETRRLRREARTKRELIEAAIVESREDRGVPTGQLQKLRQCMEKLTDRAKALVRMRYFEGKGFEEIAQIVERSAGALRVAMLKIRRELKNCMTTHKEA